MPRKIVIEACGENGKSIDCQATGTGIGVGDGDGDGDGKWD